MLRKICSSLLFSMSLFGWATVATAAERTAEPEKKQLSAMGYEIKDVDSTNGSFFYATLGDVAIVVDKKEDRTAIWRTFKRKSISSEEELELYRIINALQTDLSFQITLGKETLNVILYNYADYNPKLFGTLIRMIERADILFTAKPELLKLMNK